ncbi:alpha/beta fold hydrolase [Planobispora takensis]|uniref:Alpha/beta hydrolase n=1 Tax=Planobispora takensis TaxID=1367882 RepID=A0A8J3WXE0_9ACTN|nr:alpha/beta hydrolase [Planobispora takensis]GII05831.1 alpha/beta hydrolase [Planobispora takensis]
MVLVHGAFADASGFNDMIARLQAAGFPVIAPANPLRDVAGDAAYVSSVLDTVTGPVILVGHSYGGIVITNAARGHDNVKALVYLGAFAPGKGESALKLAEQFPGSELGHALLAREYELPDGTPGGTDGYIVAERFREVFAADLPAYKTRLMAATQRPGSVTGLSDGSGDPAWKTIPSWYLIPTQDKVIPPAAQRFIAKRAGSTVREIHSSHVVMMSHPDAAAAVVLSAYAATR